MLGIDLVQGYFTAPPEKALVQSIRQNVIDAIRTYAAQRKQGTGK